MDGRSNLRNKAAFLIFPGVVWRAPKEVHKVRKWV